VLNHRNVPGFGGTYEIVVGDVEPAPEVLEPDYHLITVVQSGKAPLVGCLLDLLPMFIGSCQEHHLATCRPHISRNDISGYCCVHMSDVGYIVNVIDRCRNIKGVLAHLIFSRNSSMFIVTWSASCISMVIVLEKISMDLIFPEPSGRVTFFPILGSPLDNSLYISYS